MKPAIFNTEMVRAILDGRKTQTRRTIKDQILADLVVTGTDAVAYTEFVQRNSPYKVGDIIYVRETWQEVFEIEYMRFGIGDLEAKNIKDCIANFETIYKIKIGMSNRYSTPNSEPRMRYIVYKAEELQYTDKKYALHWNPSTHMPKEYARLFLRVKDVRIERLNEISEHDAKAEGIEHFKSGFKSYGKHFCENTICPPIESFSRLWESIYGKDSFDSRYVWVIEFEQISKEEAMSETAT